MGDDARVRLSVVPVDIDRANPAAARLTPLYPVPSWRTELDNGDLNVARPERQNSFWRFFPVSMRMR